MKRFLIIPIIFLLASPLCAMQPAILAVLSSGGAAACTPTTGSIANFGFETANYGGEGGVCGSAPCWTETVGAGGSINNHQTLADSPPTGSCTYGLEVNMANATTTYTIWDKGSTLDRSTSTDIVCQMQVNANTMNTNFNAVSLMHWHTNSSQPYNRSLGLGAIDIFVNGATTYLRGSGAGNSGLVTITPGTTWLTLQLHLDATAASSYFKCVSGCSSSTNQTFTRNDTADGRYLILGYPNAGTSGDSGKATYGYCYVTQ